VIVFFFFLGWFFGFCGVFGWGCFLFWGGGGGFCFLLGFLGYVGEGGDAGESGGRRTLGSQKWPPGRVKALVCIIVVYKEKSADQHRATSETLLCGMGGAEAVSGSERDFSPRILKTWRGVVS